MDLPFIICQTSSEIRNEVERILSGKRFKWIDKESTDYVYELEWLIMVFFPRIFNIYRKRLDESIKDFKDAKESINSKTQQIEQSKNDITTLTEEQKTIKSTYIKTENIFEMAGLLVGGITIAIALAVGLIAILFDKKLIGMDFKFPLVALLSIIAFEIIFTFVLCYKVFSRRSQKTIEERIDEIIEARRSDA